MNFFFLIVIQLELGAFKEGSETNNSLDNYTHINSPSHATVQTSSNPRFWGLPVFHWVPSLSPGRLFSFLMSEGFVGIIVTVVLFSLVFFSSRPRKE